MNKLTKLLLLNADSEYKSFQAPLIPTVERDRMIGVRTPVIRKIAAEYSKSRLAEEFLSTLPHFYYEEYNLHAFLLEKIRDFDECICETEKLLPYIDNWATCDSFSPKVFSKSKEKLIEKIKLWVSSDHTYTVRYGIGMLQRYFLDEDFKEEYISLALSAAGDDCYIKMMKAWFIATGLAKQYDAFIPYLQKRSMNEEVRLKAIKKATESLRISDDKKLYLKSLK